MTAYMFGKPDHEILDLIEADRKRKTMTRDEAESKIYPYTMSKEKSFEILNTLEALGLLKFDEPPKKVAAEYIKRAREYYDLVHAQRAGSGDRPKYMEIIGELLDVVDNACDDIKTVKIGEMYRFDF